jgi:hypothetical protein
MIFLNNPNCFQLWQLPNQPANISGIKAKLQENCGSATMNSKRKDQESAK